MSWLLLSKNKEKLVFWQAIRNAVTVSAVFVRATSSNGSTVEPIPSSIWQVIAIAQQLDGHSLSDLIALLLVRLLPSFKL
jgi:hypothetical protein